MNIWLLLPCFVVCVVGCTSESVLQPIKHEHFQATIVETSVDQYGNSGIFSSSHRAYRVALRTTDGEKFLISDRNLWYLVDTGITVTGTISGNGEQREIITIVHADTRYHRYKPGPGWSGAALFYEEGKQPKTHGGYIVYEIPGRIAAEGEHDPTL